MRNLTEAERRLKDGFDYTLQCWVQDYIILDCGHRGHPCCRAHELAGQDIREVILHQKGG